MVYIYIVAFSSRLCCRCFVYKCVSTKRHVYVLRSKTLITSLPRINKKVPDGPLQMGSQQEILEYLQETLEGDNNAQF